MFKERIAFRMMSLKQNGFINWLNYIKSEKGHSDRMIIPKKIKFQKNIENDA